MAYVKSHEVKGIRVDAPYQRVLKIFASPDTPKMKTKNLVFGMSIIATGSKTDKHVHEGTEECIYVVTGRGEAEIGGKRIKLEPDIAILVRPGEYHQVFNHSDETMKLMWVYSPPGAEKKGFWEALEK
jgi:mannose-6-phosphate isomerase-like protein (cupin superfamily)